MTRRTSKRSRLALALAALALAVVAAVATPCRASSKEECLDAHGRGQDLRDAGRLTAARQMFLTCAQSSCPALIQSDCARFGEELERMVPTASFAARDPSGSDLTDTAVYVDEQQVATRLDDGKAYDLDPGKHTVRFVHEGRESVVTVVLNPGEKGRSVVATFTDKRQADRTTSALRPPTAESSRSAVPLVAAGLGLAAAATGGVLVAVGMKEVPSNCSVSTHECTAPPGDPSYDQAHRGIGLANLGLGVGIGGAAVLLGGVIWYIAEPSHPSKEVAVLPWFDGRSGGLGMRGGF
jgi:hypothetical protein